MPALRNFPLRAASGAFILNSGIGKLDLDAESAAGMQAMAARAFPQLAEMKPEEFGKLLADQFSLVVTGNSREDQHAMGTVCTETASGPFQQFGLGHLGTWMKSHGADGYVLMYRMTDGHGGSVVDGGVGRHHPFDLRRVDVLPS